MIQVFLSFLVFLAVLLIPLAVIASDVTTTNQESPRPGSDRR